MGFTVYLKKYDILAVLVVVILSICFINHKILGTLLRENSFLDETSKPALSGPRWTVFLRIPKTGSSFVLDSFQIRTNGCNCGWEQCQCQTKAVNEYHGIRCSQMTCVENCHKTNCLNFWADAPHADMLDLKLAFGRARVPLHELDFYTMLRHPVSRVLSEYRWVTQGIHNSCDSPNGRYHSWDYDAPCNISLEEFMSDRQVQKRVMNRQTKMVAGLSDFESHELYENDNEMLKVAKMNLEKFSWIGIYEFFNESLQLLGEHFEKKKIEYNVQASSLKRMTNSTGKVSADIKKKIFHQNSLDWDLYQYALDLFHARIEKKISRRNGFLPCEESSHKTIFHCLSCSRDTPIEMPRKSDLVRIGQIYDANFTQNHPDCIFQQTTKDHIGTLSWYNYLFGCAFEYKWFQTSIYAVEHGLKMPGFFQIRSFQQHRNIYSGRYIVAIGAAQTMGVQSDFPYTAVLEHLTGLPVISLGWGGVGAGFFVNILTDDANTTLSQVVTKIISGAHTVIVQAMGVLSESNSLCHLKCGNLISCMENGVAPEFFLQMQNESHRHILVRESTLNWVKNHQKLISLAASIRQDEYQDRIVLFLYQCANDFSQKTLNMYPQYVDEVMVDQVENFGIQDSNTKFLSVKAFLNDEDISTKVPLNPLCGRERPSCLNGRGSKLCTMEFIVNDCECGFLHINSFPSPSLHVLTGAKIFSTLYRYLPTAISPTHKSSSYSSPLKVFSLLTVEKITSFSRTLFAWDTMCFHHPNARFFIYTLHDGGASIDRLLYEKFRSSACTMTVMNFDPSTFFSSTPLESWVDANLSWLKEGPYWYRHLTDLFCLAAIWKYGGWYLDTDFIVLKPFVSLRNCFAYRTKDDESFNNAIFHFEAGHPFLTAVMRHVILVYNREELVSAGPQAFSTVLNSWDYQNCDMHLCVTILPYYAFYPYDWNFALLSENDQKTLEPLNTSFAIHFWNMITAKEIMHESSIIYSSYKRNCKLCLVPPDQNP
jgi:lactosylceramide 4-alpha-galactosyltransferase